MHNPDSLGLPHFGPLTLVEIKAKFQVLVLKAAVRTGFFVSSPITKPLVGETMHGS